MYTWSVKAHYDHMDIWLGGGVSGLLIYIFAVCKSSQKLVLTVMQGEFRVYRTRLCIRWFFSASFRLCEWPVCHSHLRGCQEEDFPWTFSGVGLMQASTLRTRLEAEGAHRRNHHSPIPGTLQSMTRVRNVLALTCWPLGRCCNCICWLLCSCCCCSAYRLQGRSHRSTCRWPLVDFADDDVITPPADTVDDVTVQMPDSCDDIVCAVSIRRTHPWSWYLEERFCYEADKIKHVLRKWRLISVKVRVQVMLSAITWITLLTFNNVRA